MAGPWSLLSQMARGAAAQVIGAFWATLLWCWVGLQLAYWAFVYAGIRRFDRTAARENGGSGPAAEFELLIPAYNEAAHLPLISRNLDEARKAGLAAIVIDDGSCDGSADALAGLSRQRDARLLRHPVNRGKAAALCSGLEAARAGIVMTLDADTTVSLPLAPGTSLRPGIGAVAFTIVPIATGRFLAAAQAAEYAYILNLERLAFAGFGIALTVPGAASLWRTQALRDIGGFSARTFAEDTDATISLQLAGWRVAVVPSVIASTDCPATLRALVRQRARWIWGNLQAAAHAATACVGARSTHKCAAVALVASSAMTLAGYLVATVTLVRFALLDLTLSDASAGAVLCAATLGRIIVSQRMRAMPPQRLSTTLVALLSMQAVNLTGFWAGILAPRKRW